MLTKILDFVKTHWYVVPVAAAAIYLLFFKKKSRKGKW